MSIARLRALTHILSYYHLSATLSVEMSIARLRALTQMYVRHVLTIEIVEMSIARLRALTLSSFSS